ncbi:helix-turn-helix domain-containing protein [Pseudoclavibacter sp. 8L]|uniref:helix-turn-helix domain-containing protein n=1 Tax=Pseudoclavibacter sp. 8L TaxID=2653162 RepID=UPI0012F25AD7|nr:helix-turn-helix transcriptional regulator [Pseudoclavibacter sp. 8L]VXC25292.1 AraC family transcriptional regulator [Pseudoclavibacter sp. 8L]
MASTDLDELRRLRRARDFIDREFASPLDVPAMAKAAHMSTAHFSRRFREAYGETPYAHLMTRRIERAKALLRSGEVSVTDACTAVGATSLGSFSSRFAEIVGESPSAYRARDHSGSVVIPSCTSQIWGRPRRVRDRPGTSERGAGDGQARL